MLGLAGVSVGAGFHKRLLIYKPKASNTTLAPEDSLSEPPPRDAVCPRRLAADLSQDQRSRLNASTVHSGASPRTELLMLYFNGLVSCQSHLLNDKLLAGRGISIPLTALPAGPTDNRAHSWPQR